jgi:spore coat protein U-like protein
MSRFSTTILKGLAGVAVLASASTAFTAQEARTLAVTATIPGGCTLVLSGPMAFGTLDVSSANNETHIVNATYQCASGVPVLSFTVGGLTSGPFSGAMRGLSPTNTDTIPYTISWTAPAAFTGTGFGPTGASRVVELDGLVLNQNYISKRADSYADAVVVAINF